MGQVRNDFGEIRVVPTLDYSGIAPGEILDVPDDEVYHWAAGGWTPLTRYPVPVRLYPNHQADPLAYALPEPSEDDPSAVAVGPAPEPPIPAAKATAAASAPSAPADPAPATQE